MTAAPWTGKTWTAKLRGRDVSFTSETLTRWRDLYVSDDDLASRMSELLWVDLYVLSNEFGIAPPEVIASINDVEAGENTGLGVKPATQFGRPPLKGFWHKHYFTAQFLVTNMLLELGSNGLEKMINEVFDNGEPRVTKEMIKTLAHRVSHEPADNRAKSNKLTGEWIIFAKHDGKNYWLCTNTHNAGDQFIYDRISQNCTRDFPDVMSWV